MSNEIPVILLTGTEFWEFPAKFVQLVRPPKPGCSEPPTSAVFPTQVLEYFHNVLCVTLILNHTLPQPLRRKQKQVAGFRRFVMETKLNSPTVAQPWCDDQMLSSGGCIQSGSLILYRRFASKKRTDLLVQFLMEEKTQIDFWRLPDVWFWKTTVAVVPTTLHRLRCAVNTFERSSRLWGS